MKYVKIILPSPAVTLGLGVESHKDLQLEDVTVILSPLPVLLVRQELALAGSGSGSDFSISQLLISPEASLTVTEDMSVSLL